MEEFTYQIASLRRATSKDEDDAGAGSAVAVGKIVASAAATELSSFNDGVGVHGRQSRDRGGEDRSNGEDLHDGGC